MIRLTVLSSALLLLLGSFAVAPPAAAEGCSISGEGSGSCALSCPGTDNNVGVSASIRSAFLQWRTIEGKAYCGTTLAAACAGHGDCSGTGYGRYGSGSCVIKTGQGVDFSGGCVANKIGTGTGPGVDPNDLPGPEDLPDPDSLPGVPTCTVSVNMMVAPDPRDFKVKAPECPVAAASLAAPSPTEVFRITIERVAGVTTGAYCADGACVPMPVVCIGAVEVACAVGLTEPELRALETGL